MKLSSIILLVLFITSCGEPNTKQVLNSQGNNPENVKLSNQSEFRVYEWEHKGHTYIIIDRAHGSGIAHAGHCPCGK